MRGKAPVRPSPSGAAVAIRPVRGRGAACPAAVDVTVTLIEGTGVIIPTLPSGGTVTFTVTATVTATQGSVTNTVSVAPPMGTIDPTPGNNTASDTDTVQPVADLSITKNDGVTQIVSGTSTTYTVVVTNGLVTDSSSRCERTPARPNPCRVLPIDAAKYTVPGLFSTVRALLAPDPPSPNPAPPTIVKLTFDAVYGYPVTISSDQPPIIHADGFWKVEEFQTL